MRLGTYETISTTHQRIIFSVIFCLENHFLSGNTLIFVSNSIRRRRDEPMCPPLRRFIQIVSENCKLQEKRQDNPDVFFVFLKKSIDFIRQLQYNIITGKGKSSRQRKENTPPERRCSMTDEQIKELLELLFQSTFPCGERLRRKPSC